uniref:Uncharacterized protein n=1 Tax=Urocitellus parryii TaxID=9999 RepID=A0A8D2I085_UROPR
VSGQNNHQHVTQELINMQLVTVQLTQLSKGSLEVVQVLNGVPKGSQHLLAMGLDLGVTHDGRGRGHVAKAVKESLGPRVDNKEDIPHSCARVMFTLLSHSSRSIAYLPKASPPVSSTFNLPHRLEIRFFSSAVRCTMMSGLGVCW